MKETGKVVKILDDSHVEIEMNSTAGCSKCGLCRIGMNNKAYLTAKTNNKLSVDDNVEIEMKEKDVIVASILVFILPLVLFFIGYIIYQYIMAFSVLVIYYVILYIYDRDANKKGMYTPQVTRKL